MLVLYAVGRNAMLPVPGWIPGCISSLSRRGWWGSSVALLGRFRGWQERRVLLVGWPVASLVVTLLVGAVEPDATRNLPGTITISFVYVGLTCPRWRSLAVVPFGVAAFIVGGVKVLPEALPIVVAAAVMWVLVAEVPAWLIAQLETQSALLRKIAVRPTPLPSYSTGARSDPNCRCTPARRPSCSSTWTISRVQRPPRPRGR